MAPLDGLTHRTIDASGCPFQESSAVWRCRSARGRSSACDLIGVRPKVPSQSCPDARPARAIPRVSHGRTAVPSMADQIAVVGGVDTHTDFHQAAVFDTIGRHLATASFPTTPDGYRRLLEWLRSHGDVLAVGVEGIGTYGSELARFLGGKAWSMSTGLTARPVGPAASPTLSMPTPPRPLSCPAVPTAGPRPATASWRPSGHCGWSVARLSSPVLRRSTRSARSSSPPPQASGNDCAACPPTS